MHWVNNLPYLLIYIRHTSYIYTSYLIYIRHTSYIYAIPQTWLFLPSVISVYLMDQKRASSHHKYFGKENQQKTRICGTKFWPNHLRTGNLPECTMYVTEQATPTRFMIYKFDRFRLLAPITRKCEVLSLLNGKERWFFFGKYFWKYAGSKFWKQESGIGGP